MSDEPTEQDAMAEIIHGALVAGQGLEPGGRVFIAHRAVGELIAAGYGDTTAAKAGALRDAADELEGQFPYNCQLRPDGSEDPQMGLAAQVTDESAIVLRERANKIAADDAAFTEAGVIHRVRDACERVLLPHQETGEQTGIDFKPAVDQILYALDGADQ